ncbi:MAG: hypothetical protein ACRDRG_03470 [Pseudonocardiaceae bacterium]
MRDYGAMNLALALVLVVAGLTMNRLLVRTALGALLVFAISHLIFHAAHLEQFSTTAAVTELVALTVAAALPAALLIRTEFDAGTAFSAACLDVPTTGVPNGETFQHTPTRGDRDRLRGRRRTRSGPVGKCCDPLPVVPGYRLDRERRPTLPGRRVLDA